MSTTGSIFDSLRRGETHWLDRYTACLRQCPRCAPLLGADEPAQPEPEHGWCVCPTACAQLNEGKISYREQTFLALGSDRPVLRYNDPVAVAASRTTAAARVSPKADYPITRFTQIAAAIGALQDGCTTSEQASCYEGAHRNPICPQPQAPKCIRHVVGVPNFNTANELGVSIPAHNAARWQGGAPFQPLFPDVQCHGPVLQPRTVPVEARGSHATARNQLKRGHDQPLAVSKVHQARDREQQQQQQQQQHPRTSGSGSQQA